MPAPYTEAQQDSYIDDLRTRVATLEASLVTLLARVATLETDSATHTADVGSLQDTATELDERLTTIESISLPAIDTLQDDVSGLRLPRRQDIDTAQLSRATTVMRPSVERVRRPDGKMAQRVTKPR